MMPPASQPVLRVGVADTHAVGVRCSAHQHSLPWPVTPLCDAIRWRQLFHKPQPPSHGARSDKSVIVLPAIRHRPPRLVAQLPMRHGTSATSRVRFTSIAGLHGVKRTHACGIAAVQSRGGGFDRGDSS